MKNLLFSAILLNILFWILPAGAKHPDPVNLSPEFGSKNEFTISCWIKFDSTMTNQTNYGILYKGCRAGFPEMQFQICIRRDRPEFKYISRTGRWCGIMMNGSDWVGIGKRVPLNQLPPLRPDHWTMLTVSFSKGTITMYVDGEEYFKTERNSVPPINAHPVYFGKSEWGTGLKCWEFPGLITNFLALEKCLSQEEIAKLEKEQRAALDEDQPIPDSEIFSTDFSKKLKRTREYEKSLPEPLTGTPNVHVKIVKHNGVPTICINNQIVSTTTMLPSPYVSPAESKKSVRDFAAAGVKLYSTILWTQGKRNDWWTGEGKYNFDAVDRRLNAILKAAPEGYIFPRIKLDPPEWWIAQNKQEMEYGNIVSPSSEKWRALYRQMLQDLVAHIEKSPYAGRVVAYQFGAFVGSEWLIYRKLTSISSQAAFAKFVQGKISSEKTDPFNPSAITNPNLSNMFLSKEIADVILDAAGVIKQASKGKKLTGIFYGYDTTQHQELDRILKSPLIDFFCSPTSYAMRNAGDAGQFTCKYWASLRLHNKLYFDEADIRTHYYKLRVDYRCANLTDTNNVIKRAIGYGLTRGTSLWWFLLVGNETFHDENIMDVISDGVNENTRFLQERISSSPDAEVAVFFSTKNQPGNYFSDLFTKFYLDTLPRSGVPFDIYPIEDANNPKLPEYKMYIFMNPPGNMPEFRRKGLKLWIYQTKFCQIKTTKHTPSVPIVGHFIQGKERNGINLKLSCFAAVNDPNAKIKGYFHGRPAAAVKGNNAWFLAIPNIVSLHELYEKAGVHIWNRSGDIVSAGNGYVMLHAASQGEKTIFLPGDFRTKEIFHFHTANDKTTKNTIQSFFETGETRVYRLTPVTQEK